MLRRNVKMDASGHLIGANDFLRRPSQRIHNPKISAHAVGNCLREIGEKSQRLQQQLYQLSYVSNYYTPNGYIVPMEFRVHFVARISAFSRRTKMHLNGMMLIGTEFFKIIVPL